MCNKGKGGVDKPGTTEICFRQSPACGNPPTTAISDKTATPVARVGAFLLKHPGVDTAQVKLSGQGKPSGSSCHGNTALL